MMTVHQVSVRPEAAWHLGRGPVLADCDGFPRSDTLYSALLSVAGQLGRRDWIARCLANRPGFHVSSWFPCCGSLRFYPRPQRLPDSGAGQQRKELKQAAFVSQALCRTLLDGKPLPKCERMGPCLMLAQEATQLRKQGVAYIIGTGSQPANVLDRLTSAASPYQRGELVTNTAAGCGWWGYLACAEEDQAWLQQLLSELGIHGIGGERSCGKGAFAVTAFEPVQLPAAGAGPYLTLALYSPTWDEVQAGALDDDAVAYDATIRGGWIVRPEVPGLRRRSVRMLTEGSILTGGGAWPGRCVDVTPAAYPATQGRVWRYGHAWPVPIPITEVTA